MAGSINRLGQWCLEVHGNEAAKFDDSKQHIDYYRDVFTNITNRAILLYDTDNPRFAIPLTEFFT